MEIEQETTEHEIKDLFKWLWVVLMSILVFGYILERYETKPETRKIYHLNEFRGYIENMKPININEHCKK
jgi:hypothetical protein